MEIPFIKQIEKANKYHKAFKFDEAMSICDTILKQDPQNKYALSIVSACYLDEGDYESAVSLLTAMIRSDPNDVCALSNMSAAMRETGHIEESESFALVAYEKNNKDVLAIHNLGQHYMVVDEFEKAKNVYKYLCSVDPKNVLGHASLGYNLALTGEMAAGLREIELAETLHEDEIRDERENIPGFRWNGMKLDNKLAIILNQGFGDSIQHASRIKSAAEKCNGIIICGESEILPLFHHIDNVDTLLANGEVCDGYSAYTKISFLPVLGCEAEPPGYIKNITPSLPKSNKPLVGLSWRGRPVPRARSISLEFLAWELKDLDVDFVNLHHNITPEELNVFPMKTPTINNFEDLAGVIASCDSVISIDNAVIHLAGAMKVPGFVLLSRTWDYRWGSNEGGLSSLYPTIEIGRQHRMGDWTVPLKKARSYLEKML